MWNIENNSCFEFRYAAQVLLEMIANVMGDLTIIDGSHNVFIPQHFTTAAIKHTFRNTYFRRK